MLNIDDGFVLSVLPLISFIVGLLGDIFFKKTKNLIIAWLVIITLISLFFAILEFFPSQSYIPSVSNAILTFVLFQIYGDGGFFVGLGLVLAARFILRHLNLRNLL